jgi:ParB/RepB/Spo0J family partition protein
MSTSKETFAVVPLEQLHESPLNTRKTFDAAKLAELTESIRVQGVITPLLVRSNAEGYEIASGHRRFRAAAAAGLESVPAIVRPMTDEQFLEVLQIENLLREDVHPLEEAAGYRLLLDSRKGYDVARIAERVGKSVKYVYDRIKLLALIPKAQELFLEDRITAGHAILLARLKPDDQKRALDPGVGRALFTIEDTLWDPEASETRQAARKADPYAGMKPRSVRELQGWIDEHVRFDRAAADPVLFPETVGAIQAASEAAEKIIQITHDHYVQESARDPKERIYGPRSWKRADKKPCEHAITGVIVVGYGRGEAFKVCIAKDRCKLHWAEEQKEAKARVRAAGRGRDPKSQQERWKEEERRRKEQQARDEAERDRWKKAEPKILEAVAAAVKKAPTKATGLLAEIILGAIRGDGWGGKRDAGDYVPRGATAEDLVRHAAFAVLRTEIGHIWTAPRDFPKRAKAFGIDVKKILDGAAPPAAEAAVASGSAAKKASTRKKGSRK